MLQSCDDKSVIRFGSAVVFVAVSAAVLPAGERHAPRGPALVHVGSLKFGKIPLTDQPGESVGTVRYSRLMLKGDLPAGPFRMRSSWW